MLLSCRLGARSVNAKLFIAYMDGKPAATLLFMNSGTAGYIMSPHCPNTVTKVWAYVTLAAMWPRKMPATEVMQAMTPDGEKVYRRIGFIEYCKAQIYKPDRFKN